MGPGGFAGQFCRQRQHDLSRGVASMGIYVDDDLKYVVNAKSLNTKLSLNPGATRLWCSNGTIAAVPASLPFP